MTQAPLLFGWDDQTWKRAFMWAGVTPISPILLTDTSKLSQEHWDTLVRVHSKWMESGGPPEGPKGSIIL